MALFLILFIMSLPFIALSLVTYFVITGNDYPVLAFYGLLTGNGLPPRKV